MSKELPRIVVDKSINEIASLMDKKFKRWDIWRTVMNQWCVKAVAECGTEYQESRSGFLEAIRAAIEWKPLPVVPRRPLVVNSQDFIAVKASNGRWKLTYNGRNVECEFKTKRSALSFAEASAKRSVVEHLKWMEKFSWVLDAEENVDFVHKH